MFEGKDLLQYFEIGHALRTRHSLSLTEYNALIPWHLDVMLSQIHNDMEESKQRKSSQLAG